MLNDEIAAKDLITAIDSLSSVTLQIHKDFKPIYVTEDYARLYGFESTEAFLDHGSIMDLIPPDFRELAIRRYNEVIETGVSSTLNVKTQRVDGTDLWVKVQDRRLKYKDGYCVLTVLIDIHEEIQLREAFKSSAESEQAARKELEKLQSLLVEQEKQNALNHLLAGVSHQFNTPLGNILTSSTTVESILDDLEKKRQTKTLRESDLSEQLSVAKQALKVIEQSVTRTNKLIKNVKLLISDDVDTERTDIHFAPFVRDSLQLFCHSQPDKKIVSHIDIDDNLYAHANPNAWMQLIAVFCDNTLRHAFSKQTDGNVWVSGKAHGAIFEFRFSDDGCGIPDARKKHIFQAFYSSEMSNNTGLGLALAYNLVSRSIKGSIRVEDHPSGGVTFIVQCPLEDYLIRR